MTARTTFTTTTLEMWRGVAWRGGEGRVRAGGVPGLVWVCMCGWVAAAAPRALLQLPLSVCGTAL